MAEYSAVKVLAFDMVATIHRLWKLKHHLSFQPHQVMQSILYIDVA